MIALIDYGAGNLTSVRKGFSAAGAELYTPRLPVDLAGADGIVVPGVGHFSATAALDSEWRAAIRDALERGVKLFGICLGLQWLFEGSDEDEEVTGLGVIAGRCRRLPPTLKVPHVGWNSLEIRGPSRLLAGVEPGTQAYFTHSYAADITPEAVAVTTHAIPVRVGRRDRPRLRRAVSPGEIRHRRRADAAELRDAMLSKRLIACLDVRNGCVVKGVQFEGLRNAGDPAALARRYNVEGIDELVILDVTATLESRQALAETIRAVSRELFIPLAVGGGIRSLDDAEAAIDAGADKVSINSAALVDPELITRLAARYGSQAIVVAIDAKRADGRFDVYSRSGSTVTARQAVEWAREAESRGAGEILLTSIDRDGTREGFDCELNAAVSSAVSIPVIASGGAGTFQHFLDVFTAGKADAALAASVFHYSEHAVSELKQFLASSGIPVRLQHT